jgi:hypothetical protein
MAAMMALQRTTDPVFDQPGSAIGALDAMPTPPAKCQRRVATAVEEKHRLLASRQRFADRRNQRRGQKMPALRGRCTQIDRCHSG